MAMFCAHSRGKPTCHKAFGEDIAILAGDALLAQSFALVAKETKGVPADRILKVITSLGTLSGAEGLVSITPCCRLPRLTCVMLWQ